MKISVTRLIVASVLGGLIGTLPQLVAITPILSSKIGDGQKILNYLLIPGLLVGLLFASGNGHDVNFTIVLAASSVVYALIAYGFLTFITRILTINREDQETKGEIGQDQ